MQTVLAKIVADKAIWVEARKQQQPLASFQNEVQPSARHFYDALQGTRTAFILECKKASPSKGVIRDDFDPAQIAGVYKHYASAISVLTDEKYFQGSFDFLTVVSRIAPQPVLCKDFIIDPYQIYLARYYQADACLLMLSVLDDEQYRQLSAVAHSLKMGVLTEVSNEEELERAIALGAKVVGINNRDLRDLSIDLNRTRQLAPKLGHGVTVISESGINTYAQVRELSHFANGFLIGSALMSHADLHAAVRRVLLGENKVCGLTRGQDAKAAYEAGAIYGGLIFVPSSPRVVNLDQAREVIAAAPCNMSAYSAIPLSPRYVKKRPPCRSRPCNCMAVKTRLMSMLCAPHYRNRYKSGKRLAWATHCQLVITSTLISTFSITVRAAAANVLTGRY